MIKRNKITFGQSVLNSDSSSSDCKHFAHKAVCFSATASRCVDFFIFLKFGKYFLHCCCCCCCSIVESLRTDAHTHNCKKNLFLASICFVAYTYLMAIKRCAMIFYLERGARENHHLGQLRVRKSSPLSSSSSSST